MEWGQAHILYEANKNRISVFMTVKRILEIFDSGAGQNFICSEWSKLKAVTKWSEER